MAEINVLQDLQRQCQSARLLAVSKLQPTKKIRVLYQQGQKDFGENYVQELSQKMIELQDLKDIRWHMIGHLQRNKARLIVGKVELIHSVDSVELANTIDKLAEHLEIQQKILIEVNLGNEDNKNGFSKNDVLHFWPLLCAFPHLNICGLMTMPPLSEDLESTRSHFRELKNLQMQLAVGMNLATPPQHSFTELSMGTSGDFSVALQEGATIVRLGTILFGERPAKR